MSQSSRTQVAVVGTHQPSNCLQSGRADGSPLDLSPGQHRHAAVAMEKSAGQPFPLERLPEEMQQEILRHALLPFGEPALVIGQPSHRQYLQSTALPILLALGNQSAYTAAACILFSKVDLCVFMYPNAVMSFLISSHTRRIRNLVPKLQVRLIERDLHLFDKGWRAPTSDPGSLVNIPMELHNMRTHGRLYKVHFLFHLSEILFQPRPDLRLAEERSVPSCYLPMTRLQMAHWAGDPCHGTGDALATRPASDDVGRVVIAPFFLATSAYQSDFLLLLEKGSYHKVLKVVSQDGKRLVRARDTDESCKYWLGATVLEVLKDTEAYNVARGEWLDPFRIPRCKADGGGATMARQHGDENEALQVLQYIAGVDTEESSGLRSGDNCEHGGDGADDEFSDEEPVTLCVSPNHSEIDSEEERMVLHPSPSDTEEEMSSDDEGQPATKPAAAPLHPQHGRIGYSSRGDDSMLSAPGRYNSPTSSSSSATMDHDNSTPAAVGGYANQDFSDDVSDSDDNDDVFSSCLETAISDAVTNAFANIRGP